MSRHVVSAVAPDLIHAERFATNGTLPSASLFSRLAHGFNWCFARGTKLHAVHCVDLANSPTPSSAAAVCWPTYIRTGDAETAISVVLGLVKHNFGASSPPEVTVHVYPAASGTATVSKSVYYNQRSSGASIVPDDINEQFVVLDGLTADTEYRVEFTFVNGAKGVYYAIFGTPKRYVNTTTTGISDPGTFRHEADIVDGAINKLVQANNLVWKHNRSPFYGWRTTYEVNPTNGGVALANTTTYTDVLSEFTIHAPYHTTLTRTTIPVKMAVQASRTAGTSTLSVRLYDGTNQVEVTGIGAGSYAGAASWSTVTGSIPAATTSTWRVQYKHAAAGSTTHRLQAVYLWPYET